MAREIPMYSKFMDMNGLILKVKRGETPAYRFLRTVFRFMLRPRAPRLPRFLKPLFRTIYEGYFGLIALFRTARVVLITHPLFQSRCTSVGRNLSIETLPYVTGNLEIHIGDDVTLGGKIMFESGRILDNPRLIIKDRAALGWNVEISVNSEVVIEEDARVAFRCRISDHDGHPREADLRALDRPIRPQDVRPVRICRSAWIGNNSHIMKGVTIGEGAIVSANSVVMTDIPPYALAMGNPAEVYFRNAGRPSKKPPAPSENQPQATT